VQGTCERFLCLPERSELRHDCREAVQLHLATGCRCWSEVLQLLRGASKEGRDCTPRQGTEVRALHSSTPRALCSITVLCPTMMQCVPLVTRTGSETAASCKHDKRTYKWLRNQNESTNTWSNKLHRIAFECHFGVIPIVQHRQRKTRGIRTPLFPILHWSV